jgi:hypothetical protein
MLSTYWQHIYGRWLSKATVRNKERRNASTSLDGGDVDKVGDRAFYVQCSAWSNHIGRT